MQSARVVFALLLFAVMLRADSVAAQQRARAFADVPFGASPVAVLGAMKALELEPLLETTAGDPFPLDQRFMGRLKNQDVLVTAVYDAGGNLEKMLVAFLTADEDCVSFYRALKTELQQKHGEPVTNIERWEFPYDKGGHVGQEHIAIRVGKGFLATVWDDPDEGSRDGGIVITTGDNIIVELAYESSKWAAEAARRKKVLDELADPTSAISNPRPPEARRTERAQALD